MKHTDIKVTGCRAVVAYCDVTGFTGWMNRALVAHKDDVVITFIQKMKLAFRNFRDETGFETLPTGDGIIAVVSVMEGGKPARLFELICSTLRLQKIMTRLISSTPAPRPAGFRIRIAAGFVYRTDEPSMTGQVSGLVRLFDFLGACMNLGSRLLEFRRETVAIITEEALDMMTPAERRRLNLKAIETLPDERSPRGVPVEELPGLRAFGLRRARQ